MGIKLKVVGDYTSRRKIKNFIGLNRNQRTKMLWNESGPYIPTDTLVDI